MKALLLAAGLGTRLRPLTLNKPKCLIEINGRPLIDKWIEDLIISGVKEILINLHYLPDQVYSYIKNSKYKNYITTVYEKKLFGTAGTLLKNINFFENEDGLLIHADNFCNINYNDFYLAHQNRPTYCDITVVTFNTNHPESCGIFELNKSGVVTNIFEKKNENHGKIANGAIYLLSSNFINTIASDYPYAKEFVDDILIKHIGKIYTYHTNDIFVDIGTPEALNSLNNFF